MLFQLQWQQHLDKCINSKKKILCGKFRKGHFEGVIDVIDRLLIIINPNYMFLGEKDFQQLFLIKKFIKNKKILKKIQVLKLPTS